MWYDPGCSGLYGQVVLIQRCVLVSLKRYSPGCSGLCRQVHGPCTEVCAVITEVAHGPVYSGLRRKVVLVQRCVLLSLGWLMGQSIVVSVERWSLYRGVCCYH